MSGGSLGAEIAQKNEKNVCGLWHHTLFSLLLRNLGPQTPSGHNFGTMLIFLLFAIVSESASF